MFVVTPMVNPEYPKYKPARLDNQVSTPKVTTIALVY